MKLTDFFFFFLAKLEPLLQPSNNYQVHLLYSACKLLFFIDNNFGRLSLHSVVSTDLTVRLHVLVGNNNKKYHILKYSQTWHHTPPVWMLFQPQLTVPCRPFSLFSPSVSRSLAPNCKVISVSGFTFPTSLVPLCLASFSPLKLLQQSRTRESVLGASEPLQLGGPENPVMCQECGKHGGGCRSYSDLGISNVTAQCVATVLF